MCVLMVYGVRREGEEYYYTPAASTPPTCKCYGQTKKKRWARALLLHPMHTSLLRAAHKLCVSKEYGENNTVA